MALDDYLPTAAAAISKDASSATLTIQVRADTATDALGHADVPDYGDALAFGTGYVYCNNVTARQIEQSAGDSADKFLFEVTATFATLDKVPVEGKARWSVSGQNESVRLKAVADAAHKVDYLHGAGSPPAEGYSGLGINVSDKGAEGVDVDDPYEVLHIDMWVAPSATAGLLADIRGLRNTVNDDTFSGPWGSYAAGECRLHSYQVSHVNGELDQVSLEFLCRENVEFGIDLADGTAHTVAKEGHDYYWQRMEQRADDADDTVQGAAIIDAHLAKVYEDGDFDDLGITNAMFDYNPPS